jgi:hypothetical protein
LLLDPAEFARLPSFCFPTGFDETETERTKKDLIFDQFIFTVGTVRRDSGPAYGVCTHVSFAGRRDAFFYCNSSKVYPTCLCFLTRGPVFMPIFIYTITLARWISGSGAPLVARNHAHEGHHDGQVLPWLIVAGRAQRMEGFLIPRLFIAEMTYIRGLKSKPFEDREIPFSSKEHFVIPGQSMGAKSISYIAMDLLVSRLSTATIIHAIYLLLLENHCVFLSSSPHHRSLRKTPN